LVVEVPSVWLNVSENQVSAAARMSNMQTKTRAVFDGTIRERIGRMTRTFFIYIDLDRRQQRVCRVEHKTKTNCKRAHSLPDGIFWYGLVPADRLGDFQSALRFVRNEHRKAVGRWLRRKQRLLKTRAAPAFKAYLKSEIDKRDAKKPEFKFSWKP
jgi:hypothetical protein